MAKKVYKKKYTKDDLSLLTDWIKNRTGKLYVEVVNNDWNDGYTEPIQVLYLEQAIKQTEKIYEQQQTTNCEVSLLLMSSPTSVFTIYYIGNKHEGIPFQTLELAKMANKR